MDRRKAVAHNAARRVLEHDPDIAHANIFTASGKAVAIATLLLDHGAEPNAYYPGGSEQIHYTVLTTIAGEGEEDAPPHPHARELFALMLDHGAEPYDTQVFYNTHFRGNVAWILQLVYDRSIALGRDADWRDPEWSMIDMGGYGKGARYFLDVAIAEHRVDLAEWVLAHGGNPNAAAPEPRQKPRAQRHAVRRSDASRRNGKHRRMIDFLGHHSRDLWNLAFTGQAERLRELLTAEPTLATATHSDGETPLMRLPDDDAKARVIVELFLANGADPRARKEDGKTAADLAEERGMFDIAALLR